MRLTPHAIHAIKSAVSAIFGADAEVKLFGSRTDDNARGGDIDLYIEPELTDADQLVDARLNAMAELHTRLGEQKIDLVINRHHSTSLPIYRVAQETGVAL